MQADPVHVQSDRVVQSDDESAEHAAWTDKGSFPKCPEVLDNFEYHLPDWDGIFGDLGRLLGKQITITAEVVLLTPIRGRCHRQISIYFC